MGISASGMTRPEIIEKVIWMMNEESLKYTDDH